MGVRSNYMMGLLTATAMMLVACNGDTTITDLRTPPGDNSLGNLTALTAQFADIPVETSLVEGNPPDQLKASSLTLHFRSNYVGATFECHVGDGWGFSPCPDKDSYSFAKLINSQTYSIQVRARSRDGRADRSPLRVKFTVNMTSGQESSASRGASDLASLTPDQFPQSQTPPTGDVTEGEFTPDREIMVGAGYSVVVPWSMEIASFSTSRTLYNMVRYVHDQNGYNTLFGRTNCNRSFEKLLPGFASTAFCEGTPKRTDMTSILQSSFPMNHLEIIHQTGSVNEKLLVSAFDAEDPDPAEQKLSLEPMCGSTSSRGRLTIPTFRSYFGTTPMNGQLDWCARQGSDGRMWFVGGLLSDAGTNGSKLKIIYTVASGVGMVTVQDFAQRLEFLLPNIVVPLR